VNETDIPFMTFSFHLKNQYNKLKLMGEILVYLYL